jgi:hypothetical protein
MEDERRRKEQGQKDEMGEERRKGGKKIGEKRERGI